MPEITSDCRRFWRITETTKPPEIRGFRSSGASRARTGDLLGAIQQLSCGKSGVFAGALWCSGTAGRRADCCGFTGIAVVSGTRRARVPELSAAMAVDAIPGTEREARASAVARFCSRYRARGAGGHTSCPFAPRSRSAQLSDDNRSIARAVTSSLWPSATMQSRTSSLVVSATSGSLSVADRRTMWKRLRRVR